MLNIYDDGIIRYRIPEDWIFSGRENDDSARVNFFRQEPMGLNLAVRRLFLTFESAGLDGRHAGDILASREKLPGEERNSLLLLATGLWMLSYSVPLDSKVLSCCELGILTDSQTLHVVQFWLDVSEAPEPSSIHTGLVIHALKKDIRLTNCSIGEPRIDCSPESRKIFSLNLTLPETLGELAFNFAQDYESTAPGEGIGLRYSDGGGIKADLYFYSCRFEFLEDGIESDDVQNHFARLEREIIDAPIYSDAEKFSHGVITGSSRGDHIDFLHSSFRLVLPEGDQTPPRYCHSHLALTAFKGQFVKIRLTYPEQDQPHGLIALKTMIDEIGNVLTR